MAQISRHGYGLGWRRSLPDHADRIYASPLVGEQLPASVNLHDTGCIPPNYDQGPLGSCTGNAVGANMHIENIREKQPDANRTPSRLMLYFSGRQMEGTINSDAGAEIRDVIKGAAKFGTAFEDGGPAADEWPYDVSKFTVRPPPACYAAAKKFRSVDYRRVPQSAQQMRGCLASGYPFVFGFVVYPSMMTDEVARTGRLPMPGPGERPEGGHAVLAIGYDDTGKLWQPRHILVRNSWGTSWGINGDFLMPYEYIQRQDPADDLWTIRTVS